MVDSVSTPCYSRDSLYDVFSFVTGVVGVCACIRMTRMSIVLCYRRLLREVLVGVGVAVIVWESISLIMVRRRAR